VARRNGSSGPVRMRTRISSCLMRNGPPSLEVDPALVHVGVDRITATSRHRLPASRLSWSSIPCSSAASPPLYRRDGNLDGVQDVSTGRLPSPCRRVGKFIQAIKDHLNVSAFDRTPRSSWIATSDRNSLNPYNPYRLGLAWTITSTRT
jgi:hypothetical protein